MILYEDTRQKAGKHKNIQKQCSQLNINLVSKKLEIGDYQLDGVNDIIIDTKQDLYEIACDLFSKNQIARFQRECKRAKENNIKLYILTEQDLTKNQLLNWQAKTKKNGQPITKVTGKQIYHKMQVYSLAFGVKWRFCKRSNTLKSMLDIFGVTKDG